MHDLISPYHPFRMFQIDPQLAAKLNQFRRAKDARVARLDREDGAALDIMPMPINEGFLRQSTSRRELMDRAWKTFETAERLDRFLWFWDEARQVIAFDPELAAALGRTAIHDVPWSAVHLPLDHFYLSWGTALTQRFSIQNRVYCLDGAYVRKVAGASFAFLKGSLMIDFTARRLEPPYEAGVNLMGTQGLVSSDPIFPFLLDGSAATTIGDAIDAGITAFENHCSQLDARLPESIASLADEFGLPDGNEAPVTLNRDRFERGRTCITDALPLLFNCLFYLTHRPEDTTERFDKPPPAEWMERIARAPSEWSRREKIKSLAGRGYHRIKFVSNPAVTRSPAPNDDSHTTVATHWRRGHWAQQPYGPEQSLRRWIWRMPVLVNADGGEIATGVVRDVPRP